MMYKIYISVILLLLISSTCFMQDLIRQKRIIGGTKSADKAWQFVTLVRSTDGEGTIYNCTGTIISSRHILTAAHCVFDFIIPLNADIRIIVKSEEMFGGINYQNVNDIEKLKIIDIKHAYCHPYYSVGDIANDIAILEVFEEFSPFIEPVKLARNFEFKVGFPVIEIGFGLYYENDNFTNAPVPSPYLLQVESYIHSEKSCKKMWNFYLPDTHICVGLPFKGMTYGDSGGPLLVKSYDNNYYQIGVSSFVGTWSFKREYRAPVFARLPLYCSWIEEITRGEAKCQDIVIPKFDSADEELTTTSAPTTTSFITSSSTSTSISSTSTSTTTMKTTAAEQQFLIEILETEFISSETTTTTIPSSTTSTTTLAVPPPAEDFTTSTESPENFALTTSSPETYEASMTSMNDNKCNYLLYPFLLLLW